MGNRFMTMNKKRPALVTKSEMARKHSGGLWGFRISYRFRFAYAKTSFVSEPVCKALNDRQNRMAGVVYAPSN